MILGLFGALVTYGSIVLLPLAGLMILITGRYPRWLWGWYEHYLRWTFRVYAYGSFFTDEYPPFNGKPERLDVQLIIEYPDQLSRWLWLVKGFLVIPNLIVWYFLYLGWNIAWFIAWWVILFTGKHPRELFEYSSGVWRWFMRLSVYTFLMRDEYPPFSLK